MTAAIPLLFLLLGILPFATSLALIPQARVKSALHSVSESDRLDTVAFNHIEFVCGDARITSAYFRSALGLVPYAESNLGTGNGVCASYAATSGDFRLVFTAPYGAPPVDGDAPSPLPSVDGDAPSPLPSWGAFDARNFFARHGTAVRAVGVEVRDCLAAYDAAVAGGGRIACPPAFVPFCRGVDGGAGLGKYVAELELYGDTVLRLVGPVVADLGGGSYEEIEDPDPTLPFLPHLNPVSGSILDEGGGKYGIRRLDHCVGNVPDMQLVLKYMRSMMGYHDFAEFTREDVGTVNSGLNSVVLASATEDVLLPVNEPTAGKIKSQIQTYLEQNDGPGVQHLALSTDDIFRTISLMKDAAVGFELMAKPSENYYRTLPERLGKRLTESQYQMVEELGILADAENEGVLLQIFTRPVADRPTFFVEIIQRIGCTITTGRDDATGKSKEGGVDGVKVNNIDNLIVIGQRPGCGGFGKGNFKELFKSIEDYEKTLKI